MKRSFVVACALVLSWTISSTAAEPIKMSIWPDQAPVGDGKFEKADVPITVHLPDPDKATGAAIVICPGGGYAMQVIGGEGHGIAKWLNSHGIAGIVLQYRLPRGNHHLPLADAQRAIRVARAHAAEWKIDPKRIGIIGFSAGGHLASTAATHFDEGNPKAEDPVAVQSCRPDFAILVYPVISMGPKGHGGSRKNLLGENPSAELVELYSNEKQVTDKTPPVFLTHAKTDSVVPVENSRMLYEAMKAHNLKSELQEFEKGTHGYNGYKGPEWDAWQKRSIEWLAELGISKEKQ
jgi:acetyl esterase/lipase